MTTLGIVIGIATVIMVLSAGAGFRSLIDSQVETLGTNMLFIETRVPPTTKNMANSHMASTFSRAGSSVAITSFKQRDLENIRKLPNVENTYGIVTGTAVASYKNSQKSIISTGNPLKNFLLTSTL